MYTKYMKERDRIRIVRGDNIYQSVIESIISGTKLRISLPWCKQRKLILYEGEQFAMSCLNSRGVMLCTAEASRYIREETVELLEIELLEEPGRIQRRESFRAGITLNVQIMRYAEGMDEPEERFSWVPTNTIDISETGMQVVYSHALVRHEPLKCRIVLNRYGFDETLDVVEAEVVRCLKPVRAGEKYRIGLRFINLPEKTQNKLLKFITMTQRKQMD